MWCCTSAGLLGWLAAATSSRSYIALLISIIIINNVDRVRSFRHICPLQCYFFFLHYSVSSVCWLMQQEWCTVLECIRSVQCLVFYRIYAHSIQSSSVVKRFVFGFSSFKFPKTFTSPRRQRRVEFESIFFFFFSFLFMFMYEMFRFQAAAVFESTKSV